MTTNATAGENSTDDAYPGYYYDKQTGEVVELQQHDGVVDCIKLGEDTYSYRYEDADNVDIESEDFARVPEFTVNNPLRVAEAIYQHGYADTSELSVGGQYLTIPSIEYAHAVTELRLAEES